MKSYASTVGYVLFFAAVAADFIFGANACIRIIGISCILCGIYWCIGREIPVGIEGRPPSFHIRGWSAILIGLLMLVLGIFNLFFASQVARLLSRLE